MILGGMLVREKGKGGGGKKVALDGMGKVTVEGGGGKRSGGVWTKGGPTNKPKEMWPKMYLGLKKNTGDSGAKTKEGRGVRSREIVGLLGVTHNAHGTNSQNRRGMG